MYWILHSSLEQTRSVPRSLRLWCWAQWQCPAQWPQHHLAAQCGPAQSGLTAVFAVKMIGNDSWRQPLGCSRQCRQRSHYIKYNANQCTMTYMQWTIFHTKRKCTKCRSYIFREVSSVHWLVMTREMQPSSASSSGQSLHSSKSPMNLSLCIYIQKVIFWWNLLCFDKVCNMLCVVKLQLQLVMAFELQYCIHCCAWRVINFGLNISAGSAGHHYWHTNWFFLGTHVMTGNARNKIQLADEEESTDELGSLILNMGDKNCLL